MIDLSTLAPALLLPAGCDDLADWSRWCGPDRNGVSHVEEGRWRFVAADAVYVRFVEHGAVAVIRLSNRSEEGAMPRVSDVEAKTDGADR